MTWVGALKWIKLTAGIKEGGSSPGCSHDQRRASGQGTVKVNVIGADKEASLTTSNKGKKFIIGYEG